MLYNRLPGLSIPALACLALINPIVVNPSGPIGSGAPNRLEVQNVQFVQITLQKRTFPLVCWGGLHVMNVLIV